jgi:hypothetical protein
MAQRPIQRAGPQGQGQTQAQRPAFRCCVCEGETHGPFALCYCCGILVGQLQLPLVPVVTMVEYQVADRMHRQLRGYKDAPVQEARQMHLRQLARLVGDWMVTDGQELGRRLGSSWDVVTTVPSSQRPAGAPVDAIVAMVPGLQRLHSRMLVRGPSPTDHLVADRQGFVFDPGLDLELFRNRTVLVVDDSVITGARAQSAAAALRLGGVRVAGVLAVGRTVDPSRGIPIPPRCPRAG